MDYGPVVGVGIIEEKRGKQLASARRKVSLIDIRDQGDF
jgi:hypothetical protein